MKLKFLLIAFLLLIGCSEKNITSKNQQTIQNNQQIVQLQTIEDLDKLIEAESKQYDSQDILVVFDFNYTLMYPVHPALHKSNMNKHTVALANLTKPLSKEEFNLLFSTAIKSCDQKLVNDNTPSIIKKFRERGVNFIVCTGSFSKTKGKSSADIISNFLKKQDIDLSSNNFPFTEMKFDEVKKYLGDRPCYKNGIITANIESKGEVLSSFLKRLPKKPKIIIFVDNNSKKVDEVLKISNNFNDMKFIVCEYSEYKNIPAPEISEKEFVDFWKEKIWEISKSKIITINNISEAMEELAKADNETLVIFDYDDVLIEPVDLALLTINDNVSDKIAADIIKNKNVGKKDVMLSLGILNRDMETQLVHEKFPILITALQSRGIKTLMLTSCGAGKISAVDTLENTRRNHLLNFGIDFRRSWMDFQKMIFSQIPAKKYPYYTLDNPSFIDGMLFASGAEKGKVLEAFLSKIPQYKFKKIIFVDDKLKNLKSVEVVSETIGAQFIGIEYTYFKTKKRASLDIEKVKKQYETLFTEKRWLADKEIQESE